MSNMRSDKDVSTSPPDKTDMKRLALRLAIFAAAISMLAATGGCSARKSEEGKGDDTAQQLLPVKYASGFKLSQGDGYICAELTNPWDTTRLLERYILVHKDSALPERLPQGSVVRVPLENTLVFSSVHCSLLQELGKGDALGGVCDSRYIYSDSLQKRLREGRLVDAGSSLTPDMERILAMQPEAILLSPYENSGYGRLQKTGIPVIECADYLETSPLGRAEWMRLFGLLYGCAAQADSLFYTVEKAYTDVKERIATVSDRPSVISERRTGAVWYMPGGKSYMATLFADAGGSYPWHDNNDVGSMPLSFENVLEKGRNADFWFIKYNAPDKMTYADLAAEYAPYRHFKAFAERRIFACNSDKCPYYEETPFHPDRLLQDFAAIFHPELFGDYTPYYFHPLSSE